jgi:hypothetical protein
MEIVIRSQAFTLTAIADISGVVGNPCCDATAADFVSPEATIFINGVTYNVALDAVVYSQGCLDAAGFAAWNGSPYTLIGPSLFTVQDADLAGWDEETSIGPLDPANSSITSFWSNGISVTIGPYEGGSFDQLILNANNANPLSLFEVSVNPIPTPEPETLGLAGLSLLAIGSANAKRRN